MSNFSEIRALAGNKIKQILQKVVREYLFDEKNETKFAPDYHQVCSLLMTTINNSKIFHRVQLIYLILCSMAIRS